MNILHLIDSGGFYGAEKVVIQLMVEQQKNGVNGILGSIGKHADKEKIIEKEAKKENLPVAKFRMRRGLNILGALKIIKFAKKNSVDIIHCHGYKGCILMGLIPSSLRKIPFINTFHGWGLVNIISRAWLYHWLYAIMARKASKTVVVSNAMLNHPKISKFKLFPICIYNGVPMDYKEGKFHSIYDEIPSLRGSFLIGAIGRLIDTKGYDILIKSFAKIFKYNIKIKLLIIGEGPQRDKLEALAISLGVKENVIFLGYRENAKLYFQFMDLFIISSFTEGLPMVLLESMRAGVPVIASNVGGIPEVLTDRVSGILVPPSEVDALAEAMLTLYYDSELREKIRRMSMEVVQKNFTAKVMEIKYRRLYEDLVGLSSN